MIRWLREHELVALGIAWAGLALWVALPMVHGLEPGLFYDEAWLAQQGRAFVEPTREGLMPPGAISTWLFGRPFPLFALPYLGSLKSQLLIPSLALFGTSLETLRATTLVWALLALLASMLLAHRSLGLGVALCTGALLASDPGFAFLARYEWGPFTTGLLCRSAGLALLWVGHSGERRAAWLLGAFVLGLGVYNRADFVLILASAALGLVLFHGRAVLDTLRPRKGLVAAGLAAFALGALPILIAAERVLRTIGVLTTRGDLGERWHTLASVLDGSHFHRLMQVGGRFDAMYADGVHAPTGLFGIGLVLALGWVALDALRKGWRALADGRGMLAVTCLALAAAMLALPGATRAHHMLNLMPFAQLLVAAVVVDLAGRLQRRGLRWLVAAGTLCIVASNANVTRETRALLDRTGGRGWWSDSLVAFAEEIEPRPGVVAVSLDWGFHLPLLFLTEQPKVLEPFWRIPQEVAARGAWTRLGDAQHVYLVHDAPYDRFGYGPPFLEAVRQLDRGGLVRAHTDREGEPAFYSVRFSGPHRIAFARGFQIELYESR